MPKIFSQEDRTVIREHLLAIGLQMLEEMPCQRISVDAVAAQAGIAKGTFYNFFPSKDRFFYAIAEKLMEEDRRQLEALLQNSPAGRERVGQYLRQRYLSGRNLYDYFTMEDLRRIMRTFPTEGDQPESSRFVEKLLAREPVRRECRPEVAVNLMNVLAMTATQLHKLQVGGKEETLEVLIDSILCYIYG